MIDDGAGLMWTLATFLLRVDRGFEPLEHGPQLVRHMVCAFALEMGFSRSLADNLVQIGDRASPMTSQPMGSASVEP
jgi:hypothetical protein